MNEIIENFFRGRAPKRLLELKTPKPAYAYRLDADTYGVLIPYRGNEPVLLRFASASLIDVEIIVEKICGRYLYFFCKEEELIHSFSTLCEDFLSIENRLKIDVNPKKWWDEWKILLGNTIADDSVYPVIAELLVYNKELKKCPEVIWGGPNNTIHDIETIEHSYEIKSTTKRYERVIRIAGEHQLKLLNNKPMFIIFIRMTECLNGGHSLESCVNSFEKIEIKNDILKKLRMMHLEPGTPKYKSEYSIVESECYPVNDIFPRITSEKLKLINVEDRISSFSYNLNIEGLTNSKYSL